MVPHPGDPLDDLGDTRQRPEVGGESLRTRTRPERPLDRRQLRRLQSRLAAQPARALEARAPLRLPRVEPVVRTHARDAQGLRHCRLRFAPREQPRGFQPTRLHRGNIPCRCGHASACDRTCEIRYVILRESLDSVASTAIPVRLT